MPKITINPCESSRIHGHGYDPETQTLALQFKSKGGPGSVYHYKNVPKTVYDDLCCCESVGKFFGSVIQAKDDDGNLRYPFEKIEPEAPADDTQ